MTRALVLLGGPVGVGKTTALRLLTGRMPLSAVLDADDVWRVGDDMAVPARRHHAIDNVIAVMRGYFEAGCDIGIVGWVFARAELYQPVRDGLADLVDEVRMLYLVADPAILEQRLVARGRPDLVAYAMTRLELIEALPFPKIDTSALSPEAVADAIEAAIGG